MKETFIAAVNICPYAYGKVSFVATYLLVGCMPSSFFCTLCFASSFQKPPVTHRVAVSNVFWIPALGYKLKYGGISSLVFLFALIRVGIQ